MSEKVLITPAELSDLVKSGPIIMIDTRDPATYAAGHLPDAVNIHDIFTYLAMSTPEGVAAMRDKFAGTFGAAGLSGKETAVVYEQSMNTGFGQSCRGYVLLRYLGYPKVKILHGGYVAWTAAGLPTSTAVPAPERKSFPPRTLITLLSAFTGLFLGCLWVMLGQWHARVQADPARAVSADEVRAALAAEHQKATRRR